eukprot:CAMPEP_0113970510 /NCGR_PEP_ID=MMETSP0011_2-20120614/11261_1 /TAXON_ID=101924 /ORGANISM="Rhodosorus marinus" /LENGTH=43 /DNA_ID=CAMNT_0000984983 /DNA_START=1165 /DNA_END=1293 /DNA_ORIENTATION=+ /assembly_acc=CAM_ASM_000156
MTYPNPKRSYSKRETGNRTSSNLMRSFSTCKRFESTYPPVFRG